MASWNIDLEKNRNIHQRYHLQADRNGTGNIYSGMVRGHLLYPLLQLKSQFEHSHKTDQQ